jgi:hypothetical protein
VASTRNLAPGQEVSWIREDNKWDQIRLSDGTELWVQSKEISLARLSPSGAKKPSGAELAVQAFYQAVARHDYSEAYKYLAPEWKAELDFDHFVKGYDRAENLRSEIVRAVPLAADRYQVDIKVLSEEFGEKKTYIGFYTVEKKGEAWQMSSGELNLTAGSTPAPQPDAVPTPAEALPAQAEAVPLPSEPSPSPPSSKATPSSHELLPLPVATATPVATPTPTETDAPGF